MNGRPPESWENWPTAGGMRSGSLFQRPKWEPATGETAGSALPGGEKWPTSVANEDNKSPEAYLAMKKRMGERDGSNSNRTAITSLQVRIKMWTTPDVCSGARDMSKIDPEAQKRSDTKRTTGLPTEAAMWLTPNVPNGGRSVSEALVQSKGQTEDGQKRTVGLESQTRHWGTPQARDYRSPDSPDSPNYQRKVREGYTIDLNSQASNWPTPAARDAKGANSVEHVTTNGTGRMNMDQLANFVANSPSSPQARLIQFGETSSVPVVSVHGKELSPTTSPDHVLGHLRLNPAFGCWLMGWPFWWANPGITSSVKSEMVSWRLRQQSQLFSLFGARLALSDAA